MALTSHPASSISAFSDSGEVAQEAEADKGNLGGSSRRFSESSPLLGSISPGAPDEKTSPLGQEVTLISAIMLNIGQITGSGIYSVPGVMLSSVGSIGLLLLYWLITPLFAFAGLSLYTELASMFPHRSGAEVVYLEKAYPRPKFFVSTIFAVIAVLTSFSASNAIVFAQYFLAAFDVQITAWNQTITALAVVLVTVGSVGISTKGSLRAVNILTTFKMLSLTFIVVTGVAVLAGATAIEDPWKNFENPFEGTTTNVNALATAFIKCNHAFIGWHNAFNVLGEVRGNNPVGTVRKSSRLALAFTCILFFFINVAYVAVVPREEIRKSGQLVAVLFFRRVFGPSFGAKAFPLMVSLSCVGNIIAVTIGQSRIIREVARQGLLPYPDFFSSTRPFGTPLGPVLAKGGLTFLVILAVPARDAFNFVVDLASYPNLIFLCALVVGVWRLRKNRAADGISPSKFQASNVVISVYLFWCILLLVLPWVPPEPGHADVSFWYATYCVAGIGLLLACAVYYVVWIKLMPKLGNYEIVEETQEHSNGARNTRLIRRYKRDRLL
ncbi:amino acid transporter [Coprinopsis marcescibilis]|uniref:Amino acid transporter n=1 Tax=Coprinopsis marcescibilis TaxID=230819 RepID=A0A5C3L3E6_COPMA|nr:amino acid transporter [Coprinopsis marcescibilis]